MGVEPTTSGCEILYVAHIAAVSYSNKNEASTSQLRSEAGQEKRHAACFVMTDSEGPRYLRNMETACLH
jgi:hypothetical protein